MRGIICLAVVLICAVSASVVDLTADNFDSVVDGSKDVFIEFFAPWCGHCKKLAPEYEIVGEAFARQSGVVIAKVDADAHKDLGSRFEIQGFPTLKFFAKGNKQNPLQYEGGRTAEDIVAFINEKTGTHARIKKAPTNVVDLDDTNFNKIALDSSKDVLVEFYAPWCGHCKSLVPTYEKLANVFSNERDIVVAKIDADKNKDVGGRYGVSGFPTLKWFGKANKESPEPYEGARELGDFVRFINSKSGTRRTNDGALDSTAGRLVDLDELAQRFTASGADQTSILQSAGDIVAKLADADSWSGKVYVKVMTSIQQSGISFISNELARLERLSSGSVTPAKLDELTKRKNILSAFTA